MTDPPPVPALSSLLPGCALSFVYLTFSVDGSIVSENSFISWGAVDFGTVSCGVQNNQYLLFMGTAIDSLTQVATVNTTSSAFPLFFCLLSKVSI